MREDWIEVELGKALIIERGGSPRPIKEYITDSIDGINWIKIGDTQINSKYIKHTSEKIKLEGLKKSRFVKKGDLLLSNSMSFGRPYILDTDGAIHDGWLVLKDATDFKIDSEYLYYVLSSPIVSAQFDRLATGSTVRNLNIGLVSRVIAPIAPFPIQRAIVYKIENLFVSLDKGITDLKTAQEQLKVYRQAVLQKAFKGEFTNIDVEEGELAEGWKWVKIDSLLESEKNALKAGPFGSSLKKEFYVKDGYKIYGQEQVISGNPFYGDYYIDEQKYQELFSCRVKPGDILISLVGTVGKVLVLPDNIKEGIINPRLVKISLDKSKYDKLFFKYYFESSKVKSIYKIDASGTTMNVLNVGIIKKIPFPLPPTLAEQHDIVREIESRLSVCDKVEQSIAEALEKAEALRQSILKKAFEGKLLSEAEIAKCKQEADYEPASELLKKIKAEKK